MKERNRLGINVSAQIVSYLTSFLISFFLAPYVIRKLGTEAYGYIGLANNFVSYTILFTIALNSMAGRFITISFHEGNLIKSQKYYSSVYYSNLILALFIFVLTLFFILFLDQIIEIPFHLVLEVKLLFALIFLNSIIALSTNIYAIAAFIKNRLDLTNIIRMISHIIRAGVVIISFRLFFPHLWYYGIGACLSGVFVVFANRRVTKKLLPELRINRKDFDIVLVKELISSGAWNLLSKLSDLLSSGFDLLLANLFIGASAMGTLSISKTVPIMILSFCASLSGVFAPKLTELYAKKKHNELKNELINNIRIMSAITTIPLIIFIVLGQDFFRLWVPTEDNNTLYLLAAISVASMIIAMPQETLWNIFTITNKVKMSSISLLVFSILIFITIFLGVIILDDDYSRLLSIVIARFFWGGIRSLTFLPIYGAKSLGLKWNTFYPIIFKNLFITSIITAIFIIIEEKISIVTWFDFALHLFIMAIIIFLVMSFSILSPSQRKKISRNIKRKIKCLN